MSLPQLLSDLLESQEDSDQILDQHFGMGIRADEQTDPYDLEQYPFTLKSGRSHVGPLAIYNKLDSYPCWNDMVHSKEQSGISTVKADKNKFQVMRLDMRLFKPEEINVKVVEKLVVVEAKHEEKLDEHGWISRQFARKYIIPEQCDIDQVTSSLSSDSVLSIVLPRKDKPKTQIGWAIKIERTGKPAIQEKA